MGYLLIRETEEQSSDGLLLIDVPEPSQAAEACKDIIANGASVTGQFLYGATGYNGVKWRDRRACQWMEEAEGSLFAETGAFPTFRYEVRPHTSDDQFDAFGIDPHDFTTKHGMMGTFGSNEREIVASWLVRWAQHLGGWERPWAYDDLNAWHNEVGGWKKWSNFSFWHLNQDTWYSQRREFREAPGHMVISHDDGKTYSFTRVFVQRCLDRVNRRDDLLDNPSRRRR